MAVPPIKSVVLDVSELLDADLTTAHEVAEALAEKMRGRHIKVFRLYHFSEDGRIKKVIDEEPSSPLGCSEVLITDGTRSSVIQVCYIHYGGR